MSGQLLTFAQFRYLERKLQDTEKINEVGWPFPSPSERAMTDHVVGIAAREMLVSYVFYCSLRLVCRN